jgi:hypothetical protein
LTIGEPILTAGMTIRQTDELTTRLRAAIEALLQSSGPEATSAVADEAVGTRV